MAVARSNYGNKFDMVLCLDADQTSALANLLGMMDPNQPVIRQLQRAQAVAASHQANWDESESFTNVELFIPPNYHQELLTIRKEAFGY
jgi:hypothetical protein